MATLGTLSFDTKLNAQAVKDADDIKKRVLQKIGKGITIGVKPDFKAKDIKSSLQSTLNSIKPKVKVDIIVDQASASQAVQQALAKAGLTNNMTAGQLRAQRAAYIQQKMALDLARAQREASRAADQHSKSLLTLNSHFGNGISLGGRFSATVASIYSVYTLKNFVQQMIEIGGEFQKQRIALETMLGSLSKADAMYKRMKNLAVESPFTFMDLMSYTKQLKAFQIPYNELFETTKRLGDISAGLGVDMNRLILAFGQVRAASFLRGQEVRQFTEAGIPLIEALSNKFTELEGKAVSVGDVFDRISKRQVSFGMVKDVLWELTDEGGQFYNMQEKLTESLSGKLDKLKDSYQIMVAEMAQGNNAVLGGMLDIFTKLVSYGDKVIGMIFTLTGAYLAYKAAVIAVNAVHSVSLFVSGIKQAAAILTLTNALQGLTAVTWRQVIAQKALNLVSNANWIALAAAAITTATGMYLTFREETENLAKSTRELRAEIQEEFEAMDEAESKGRELIRTMFKQKEGTDQQRYAYERLQELYPQMFKSMSYEQALRKTNIELLQMETKAAREAMKAKLDERVKDAEARLTAAKTRNEQYNPKDDANKNIRDAILAKGSDAYKKKFNEEAKKAEADYIAVLNELDELKKIQEEANKKAENATSNRSAKWWNSAKKLAGEFASYAPKEDATLEEYQETIAKQLNSRKGFLKSLNETAENYADVEKEVKTLEKIYTAIGGNVEKLSKYKSDSGSDKLLKKWEADFSALQAFYQEYVKWAKSIGEEKALKKLYESGLWGNLFDDKGNPKYDMRSWDKAVQDFRKQNGVVGGTTERDKFLFKTKKSEIDFQYDINQKDLDRALSDLNEYISKQSSKYNLYKTLLEKTGSRDYARAAFGDGKIWDDLARDLEKQLQNLSGEVDIDYTMTDSAAKKHFESINGGYELWKKIVEITSGNYVDALNKGADAMEKSLTATQKLRTLQDQLAELERARSLYVGGDLAVIRSYNEQIDAKKRQIQSQSWDVFKEQNNWGQIFGNLDKMPLQTIRKMITAMKEYSKVAKMDVTETKAWYEALEKLLNREMMLDPIKSLTKAMEDYNAAHKKRMAVEANMEAIKNDPDLTDEQKKEILAALEKDRIELLNKETDALERVNASIKTFSSYIRNLGSSLSQLGNKIGGRFGDIMNGVSGVFDDISNAMDSAADLQSATQIGGFVGALSSVTSVLGIVSSLVGIVKTFDSILPDTQSIYEKYAERAREINDMRAAVDDYRIAVAEARAEESEWFAGNDLSALRANGEKAKETLSAYFKELYEPQEVYKDKGSGLSKWAVPIVTGLAAIGGVVATIASGGTAAIAILGTLAAMESVIGTAATIALSTAIVAGVGSAVGQIAQSAVEGIIYKDGQIEARKNMRIQTQHSSFWRGEKTENLEEWARENIRDKYGKPVELFDEEGLVNLEAAEQILEKYGNKLVGETQETLQRLVDLRKEYDEFIKQIEDYAGQIGTSLADNMTNALWDWLSDGESALDKFREYASDTWRQIAQDIIKTFYKVTILDKYADTFKELFKSWSLGGLSDDNLIANVAALSGMIVNDFETATPMGEKLATMLKDYFGDYGYDITNDNGGSSSSSKEIKSITEDTGSLLASYVNAIRADLSVIRVEQSLNLPLITAAVQRTSALAEIQVTHMQQVAANTLRNADAADRIYDLLHGVAPDGSRIRIA